MLKQVLILVSIFVFAEKVFSFDCHSQVPEFPDFDIEKWSGKFRYTLYQGTYEDAGAADCQLKYWVQKEFGSNDMLMNKTYRYYDGSSDITGSFTGDAKEERAGEWELTLSQGDIYHIAMVDTDYETYAAYVECNGDFTRNFPVISSTTLQLPEEKIEELTVKLAALESNMEMFTKVHHDEFCRYFG